MRIGRVQYRQGKGGFTVVELLIVIVVIAILATILILAYKGVSTGGNDNVAKSDLRSNLDRIGLFYAKNGRVPSSIDISNGNQSDDYKIKVSKRSTYAFYGYCTGKLNNQTEIIMTAGTVDGHQYYISSADGLGVIKDVSSDFKLASAYSGEYKCPDYLRPGSSIGEFRNMIHRDGGVEGGYIIIVSK